MLEDATGKWCPRPEAEYAVDDRGRQQEERFRRLAPRHRECLRLVYDRKRTKEIAAILDLAPGTVSGYVADAVKLLDARDRIDAAEQLVGYENLSPSKNQGDSSWVDAQPDGAQPASSPQVERDWRTLLPIRLKGVVRNELGIVGRLFWIPILAIALASGFGMLASGIRTVSDLISGEHAP